jgi:hypothetical protein
MNDKPQLIREKCVAATPELVELKFGCEVSGYIAGEDGDPMWADYETGVVLHEGGYLLQTQEVVYSSLSRRLPASSCRLTFHMFCCFCGDYFSLQKNMLELTSLAALNDQQFVGDDIYALDPHPCNRPN